MKSEEYKEVDRSLEPCTLMFMDVYVSGFGCFLIYYDEKLGSNVL